MKSLRMFSFAVGVIAMLGAGAAEAAYYRVCWPSLGVYDGPGTHHNKITSIYNASGDFIETDSSVFWANNDYWVRGWAYTYTTRNWYYGYVRWNGLCH